MAVPKRKTTPSKRKMRRSHHAIKVLKVVTEKTTGEYTLPHHISVNGYYRGRKVLVTNDKKKK
ncbi:MAG: 50S ribosomal protein L32 [Rickettsiaceae bacterium H1]|nr:50S ribosomal protein L32 [Rickettsiaceae bacterium H1]